MWKPCDLPRHSSRLPGAPAFVGFAFLFLLVTSGNVVSSLWQGPVMFSTNFSACGRRRIVVESEEENLQEHLQVRMVHDGQPFCRAKKVGRFYSNKGQNTNLTRTCPVKFSSSCLRKKCVLCSAKQHSATLEEQRCSTGAFVYKHLRRHCACANSMCCRGVPPLHAFPAESLQLYGVLRVQPLVRTNLLSTLSDAS